MVNGSLNRVLEERKAVFQAGLGTLSGLEVKIYVDQDARPRYPKARPVPYVLKKGVAHELERLKEGIISPVEFSQ